MPVFRFAPSPNGHLHLGHAYSALFTAHWARELGGECLLRLEDIDPTRCKPEFAEAIAEDLHWLGLDWPEPVLRQSDRMAHYMMAGDRLTEMGLLYPCFCSRSDVAATAEGADPDGAPLYPGTCRHLHAETVRERLDRGEHPNWRLDVAAATARTGLLTYTAAQPTPADRPQIRYARPERWGDVVLQRKDTPTSYHLAVVIDDALQGVSDVARGMDLFQATSVHRLLQVLLDLPAPNYRHHRLILDGAGDKLSKSRGSTTLRDLRAEGATPADVRRMVGLG